MKRSSIHKATIHLLGLVIVFSVLDVVMITDTVSLSKGLMPAVFVGLSIQLILRIQENNSLEFQIPATTWKTFAVMILFLSYISTRALVIGDGLNILIYMSYFFLPIFAMTIFIVPRSEHEINQLLWYLLGATAIAALLTLLDVLQGAPRPYPLGLNPNSLGLTFVAGLAVVYMLYQHKTLNRIATLCIGGILLVALVTTESREAYISLIVGVSVVSVWFTAKQGIKSAALGLLLVLSFAGVALLAVPDIIMPYIERAFSVFGFFVNPSVVPKKNIHSLQARFQIYQFGLMLIQEKPLLGHGFGTFHALTAESELFSDSVGAHSTYLFIATQLGLVGLALFLLFVGGVFATLRKLFFVSLKLDSRTQSRIVCLIAAFTALSVNGFAAGVIRWKIYWIIIGIAFAYDGILTKKFRTSLSQ
jgi:O-antigen ligase